MKDCTIDTIEKAFTYTGRNPKELPIVDHLPEEDQQSILDDYSLKVVVEAINQEFNDGKKWIPNYNDKSKAKYEPRFWVEADEENPAGFGFSNSYYDYWHTGTDVGSRLCYISPEAWKHGVTTFKELYIRIITRKK